ncbi:ATP-dependent (S)-NAD(P)H-hydrate dehydratase [Lingula anatina]|uniref:ATP-dependent NAD(P)H-hydrate dehydratase n=1 Tax=Lingula anatina TaxID=7574 RepID=A0A1S3JSS8_LINAN|nr:ATP-dependent (S)-NAD(P)H-hydrate dehydratase [Lingula anatina]|eukprot:XP_013413089.1 ATP-dependent (S)-NAD(P)H-hydrate dehydratase [Lingula anatina]
MSKDLPKLPSAVLVDGLFLVTQDPDVIKSYTKTILTPNVVEFERLFQKMMGHKPDPLEAVENVTQLSKALGNVTIVQKGDHDVISDGNKVLVCSAEGGPRRCGGQGDLLSGTMGTFVHWANWAVDRKVDKMTSPAVSLDAEVVSVSFSTCLCPLLVSFEIF